MSKPGRSRVIRLAEAQAGIPGPAGERAVMVLQRGTLDVALGLPVRPSQQTPHAQDEIYFIIRGRGVLIHDSKRDRFQATSCSWSEGTYAAFDYHLAMGIQLRPCDPRARMGQLTHV